MKRRVKVFLDTLKKSLPVVAVILLFILASVVIIYLYGLPCEPFIYLLALIVFIFLIYFLVFLGKEIAKAEKREMLINDALSSSLLPEKDSLSDEDYGKVISILQNEVTRLRNEFAFARQEDIDYYSAWVHQIKTPIAVMRMELGGSDTKQNRRLEAELFRIEQYVDMVLTFVRLGGESNDLVIKEYPLDEIVRETVRKFAPQFVLSKLQLNYDGIDTVIVTDKKWFSCILEQLLSNAIKYTKSGSISISEENGFLTVSDTGIGIASEDLPRIFEKGYTGGNGRLDKRSSGLGLYLCKKAAELLSIPLSVKSTVGKGSAFTLDLNGCKPKKIL